MEQETIFTKIIKGDIPSYKIYEDEYTLVILDIHPIQPGQVLVIAKKQVENFYELEEQDARAFWATIRKVGAHLKRNFSDKKRIGVMIEGLDVAHVHAKVFPIDSGEEFRAPQNMSDEPDHPALEAMCKKLTMEKQ